MFLGFDIIITNSPLGFSLSNIVFALPLIYSSWSLEISLATHKILSGSILLIYLSVSSILYGDS